MPNGIAAPTPIRTARERQAGQSDDTALIVLAGGALGVGAWLLLRHKTPPITVTPGQSACPVTIKPRHLYRDRSNGRVYVITDACLRRYVTAGGFAACNYSSAAIEDVDAAVINTVLAGPDVTGPPCPPAPLAPVAPPPPPGPPHLLAPGVGGVATVDGRGYWLVGSDGDEVAFGSAQNLGGMQGRPLNAPLVGITASRDRLGYWMVAGDGGVFAFGAIFYGSMGGKHLNAPMTCIDSSASGHGYLLAAADGGVFAFGDAGFFGSMAGRPLNAPVVGIATRPQGDGYWLCGADGGVFAFGGAPFLGNVVTLHLNAPVVDIEPTPTGLGYWMCAADGGVFAFGDAPYLGGCAGVQCRQGPVGPGLNAPVDAMSRTPSGQGYWLFARDGGVFAFGDAPFLGSTGANPPPGVL